MIWTQLGLHQDLSVEGTEAVSRYRVSYRLGQGGMGEVCLALDTQLDRKVALKFLSPAIAVDEDARRRLLREAQAAAALDHPFICKTYETGELDGRPFIAMEYVEGVTLQQRLAGGPLPLREAVRIAFEVAEALEYAHARGIVHRDLKPSNVMLTGDGHAKLLDFGVARRMLAPAGGLDPTRSADVTDGGIPGTLAYMSPEQLEGQPADAQSDVYAFGLVLHEMLTGAHPYERSSPVATAGAILSETGPLPSLAERVPGATDLLDHILGRMLARRRESRYLSARDVRADLAALMEGKSSRQGPVLRRRWPRAAAVAMLAVAGAIAIVVIAGRLRIAEPVLAFQERDWLLIADFDNLTPDPMLDRPLLAALTVGIAQSQHVNVVPQARVREVLRRMQRESTDRLDEEAASEVAIRERIRAVLACSVAQVGESYVLAARLIDPATRAAVLTESVTAPSRDQVLSALDELARRVRRRLGESLSGLAAQGRPLPHATTPSLEALHLFVEARRLHGAGDPQAAMGLYRQALDRDPDFALAHADLGFVQYLNGSRAEGDAHFTRALSLLDRLTTREQLWIRALADDTRGNRDEAVAHYTSYLSQYPDDSVGWFRLGWTLMAGLQRPEQAAQAFERVLTLDPGDASAQVNLATALSGLRREEDAIEAYEKAFTLRPEYLTGQFINHEYGFTLVRGGQVEKAASVFTTMTEQPGPSLKSRGHRSLALLEMYRGRFSRAVDHLREAILISQANGYGSSELRDRLFLASVYDARGMRRAALDEVAAADRLAAGMTLAPTWLHMLGRAQTRHGQVRNAERVLARMTAAAGDPTAASGINRSTRADEASMRLLRGEVALAHGRASEALAEFEIAHRVQPGHDTMPALADAYLALERYDEAAVVLEDLLARRPLGGEGQSAWQLAHLKLGAIHERRGAPREAAALYESLLSTWQDADPDLPAAHEARRRLQALNSVPSPPSQGAR